MVYFRRRGTEVAEKKLFDPLGKSEWLEVAPIERQSGKAISSPTEKKL